MLIVKTTAPEQVLKNGGGTGHWYRCTRPDAEALLYWKGGPNTPDHDLVLHTLWGKSFNEASDLLRDIMVWADQRKLDMTYLEDDPGQFSFWADHGFQPIETRYGMVIVGRRAGAGGAPTSPLRPATMLNKMSTRVKLAGEV